MDTSNLQALLHWWQFFNNCRLLSGPSQKKVEKLNFFGKKMENVKKVEKKRKWKWKKKLTACNYSFWHYVHSNRLIAQWKNKALVLCHLNGPNDWCLTFRSCRQVFFQHISPGQRVTFQPINKRILVQWLVKQKESLQAMEGQGSPLVIQLHWYLPVNPKK